MHSVLTEILQSGTQSDQLSRHRRSDRVTTVLKCETLQNSPHFTHSNKFHSLYNVPVSHANTFTQQCRDRGATKQNGRVPKFLKVRSRDHEELICMKLKKSSGNKESPPFFKRHGQHIK
jgi:hypothetical protein